MNPLYIFDGTSYIYRAFHAIRNLSTSDGRPTNAIFGFLQMLSRVFREFKPDRAVMVFDARGKNFRHELFPAYKANRSAPPEALVEQIPAIRELVDSCGMPVIEAPGYEADDVIGTLAKAEAALGRDAVIISGDKDLMQLVGLHVTVYDPMKERRYDPDAVKERYGVTPALIPDLLALAGDSSDNIPGVSGVGDTTAARLVNEFGPIEWLYRDLGRVKQQKLRERLEASRDDAILSKKLSTIDTAVPLKIPGDGFLLGEPDSARLDGFAKKFEFKSIALPHAKRPAAAAGPEASATTKRVPEGAAFRIVLGEEALEECARAISASESVAVDTETTSTEPMRAHLVGISIATSPGRAYYIPVGHRSLDAPKQIPWERTGKALSTALAGKRIVTHNGKYDLIVLKRHGVEIEIGDDTMIASYLLEPEGNHSLKILAKARLGRQMSAFEEVAGKDGAFDLVPVDRAAAYSCDDADATLCLNAALAEDLEGSGLNRLYRDVEMPLVGLLAGMEMNGVLIDRSRLEKLSAEISQALEMEAKGIHAAAGVEFNIASTKQLAEVLFNRLGLRVIKRNKTGPSTDSEVLEELSGESEVAGRVLAYRSLLKLKDTYLDALPQLLNPATGRIHCSFNQAATATGRLSSSQPNLQNIPVRTPLGRTIREAFIADPGMLLLSADYSQIELRVLAHLSGDRTLCDAFHSGEDIHRRTASEIFSVPQQEVTQDQRRAAKTINFGIVYGMGAFRLARDLGIKRTEAQSYIDGYFARIPGVREFIDNTIRKARADGFVTTIMGRRRAIKGLDSRNDGIRRQAERVAVNTPIQGSAADIMKVAMLRAAALLGPGFRLLLQVHDELLFEVEDSRAAEMAGKVAQVMENAVKLSVPLKVDAATGPNWAAAH